MAHKTGESHPFIYIANQLSHLALALDSLRVDVKHSIQHGLWEHFAVDVESYPSPSYITRPFLVHI